MLTQWQDVQVSNDESRHTLRDEETSSRSDFIHT